MREQAWFAAQRLRHKLGATAWLVRAGRGRDGCWTQMCRIRGTASPGQRSPGSRASGEFLVGVQQLSLLMGHYFALSASSIDFVMVRTSDSTSTPASFS